MNRKVAFLNAISAETRFSILESIIEGEKCVCGIQKRIKRTQSTVSIHLSKLADLGIVESRREGHRVYYRIKDYRVCEIFKPLGYTKAAGKRKCCSA